jgi:DNA polymerase-3 subunit beta
MKIECIIEKIKERVIQAERITGKNLSLPILGFVMLIAEKKSLKIRSTNLDLGVEFTIPAKVEKEGCVVVSGSVLSGIFSGLFAGKNVTLELVNENLVITTVKNTTLIKSYPVDDFPIIPQVKKGVSITIPAEDFVFGVRSVGYSSAVSDIKPEIASVYMYNLNKKIVFAATDSFRLAEKSIKKREESEFQGVIIPIKNINEIIRVYDGVTQNIKISFDQNQIMFLSDGVCITSRIINGIYPDYKQIIPTKFTTEATTLKEDVVNALKLTNVFTDKFNKVNIKADPKNKTLELSAKNIDVGENMTSIDARIEGDGFDMNFNYKYVLDGFQSIQQDSVVLKYDSEREVLIIRGVSDDSFVYLVKPMNK